MPTRFVLWSKTKQYTMPEISQECFSGFLSQIIESNQVTKSWRAVLMKATTVHCKYIADCYQRTNLLCELNSILQSSLIIKSMWLTLFLFAALTLLYMGYFFYLKPKMVCQRYATLMRQLGYKVHVVPFKPFRAPNFDTYKKLEIDRKDAYYNFKHELQGYDAIISNMLHFPQISFTNWNLAKEIFNPQKVFQLSKADLGLSIVKHIAGRSLFVSEGQEWKAKRKVFSRIFNYDFVTAQIPNIMKICDRVFDEVEADYFKLHPGASTKKIETKFSSIAAKIFGSVILTCFLGVESLGERIQGKQLSEFIMEQASLSNEVSKDPTVLLFGINFYKLGLRASHRKLKSNHRIMEALASNILQTIRKRYDAKSKAERSSCGNIIEYLLYLQETESAEGYSNSEIAEEILLFFAAATDTSTYFFSMMVFFIFEHPQVEQKLRALIEDIFRSQEDYTAENLKKILYIDWIQYETTRMFGPIIGIFARKANEDIFIRDIPIQKGMLLTYNAKVSFFDANLFADPHTFKPERWDPTAESNQTVNLAHLLTFGFSGGPRTCIGKYLAMIESKIALIKFMKRYRNVTETKERVYGYNFMSHLPNTQVIIQMK